MVSFTSFDIFPKTLEDYRVRTYAGALVSVVSSVIIILLVISEVSIYFDTITDTSVFVDTSRNDKLRINVDITFPRLPCDYLSLDAMDISGEAQLDVFHNIFKKRLSPRGTPIRVEKEELNKAVVPKEDEKPIPSNQYNCESCYGAETAELKCCKTCEDVREAYRKKGWAFGEMSAIAQCVNEGFEAKLEAVKNEGCQVYGYLMVSKVAGNFHVAPGKSFQGHHTHVHDLQMFGKDASWDLSHSIAKLSFGDDFPGIVNPLDGVAKTADPSGSMLYQYFVKVVPTQYEQADGTVINTNQFSATEYSKNLGTSTDHGLPGVFFLYDLSPIKVRYEEQRHSLASFLTGLCAIIGGVYTVSGLLDSFIYTSMKSIKKKMELGKAS
eukprot:TRINITY_DN1630_c0_g1_i1.p1 TRINITY_DN1630_c0_g1~~TRINITY_DN1630_c0_g1_i1.p1  ORF type:complete len:382 (-),score=139.60 TRINITY_DN1630_c0_g1_i1:745-1890(-)